MNLTDLKLLNGSKYFFFVVVKTGKKELIEKS